jgi:predicted AAA+ superfamily ATPase
MTHPREVFEESTSYALSKELRPRNFNLEAIVEMSRSKIVAVTGVRRSGKSSLLMLLTSNIAALGEKVAYINAEDSRLPTETLLEEALKWFGDEGYLIIDEITSAGDWSGWLARNHDMQKGKLKLIVSSSRTGLVLPPKALRGRIRQIEVFPLSFPEFADFRDVKIQTTTAGRGRLESLLVEYERYGGFPEIALLKNGAENVATLNDYFQQIVALDVAESAREDVAAARLFSRYVLSSPYFSASKCLNYFKTVGYKIGKEKILVLEQFAQESYLFFFVPVAGRSVKDRAQYPRKSYPVDSGLLFSVGGIEDKGRLLECVVFLELRRRLRGNEEIHYWRNASGGEVDFIIMKGAETVSAYQVTYEMKDPKTRTREIRSLGDCLDEIECDNGMMITWGEHEDAVAEDRRVKVVKAIDWLMGR